MSEHDDLELFGVAPDGTSVHAVTLRNAGGLRARVLSYGGVLQSLEVPDHRGDRANVVLGFESLSGYVAENPYFGAVIGRYANRIADARFTLDGHEHHLHRNDPHGTVHGGPCGFDKQHWSIDARDAPTSVRLHRVSPDGEGGFPGTLDVSVTYEVLADADTLRISYAATTDSPTVVTMTNHSYFNLAGEGSGSVLDHVLQVDADSYLPVTEALVPTGRVEPVEGTPFDFRSPHPIGRRIRARHEQLQRGQGYDHNYVIGDGLPHANVRRAAVLEDPRSGRVMEVWTTEPGLDVYSGNFLDGTLTGPSGRAYRSGDAIALEPEHFTDSPNIPHFPTTVLRPGERYESTTEYRFR